MSLPLHPFIVHIPVALALLIPLLSVGIWLSWHKGWLPSRGWFVVLALQAVMVIGALAARSSGEGDEERVERVVSEAALEAHESAADRFLIVAGLVLLPMIAPLLLRKESLRKSVAGVASLSSFAVLVLALDVGQKGGQLVYRDGAAQAHMPSSKVGALPAPAPDDDD